MFYNVPCFIYFRMKRDSLVIATASVMILAFTLSLLNIYVFPDIFFNTKIEYNTQSETLLGLLHQAENIGVNSNLFENMNVTFLLYDAPENAMVNISLIISSIEARISAVYDFPELMPRRMTINYNGTIHGVSNNSVQYEDWIETVFDNGDGGTYFSYWDNVTEEYISHSRHENLNVTDYTIEDSKNILATIFQDENRRPDFVIYQLVSYTESRGLFSRYSTNFERIIFVEASGSVTFFMSNEGIWKKPFLL